MRRRRLKNHGLRIPQGKIAYLDLLREVYRDEFDDYEAEFYTEESLDTAREHYVEWRLSGPLPDEPLTDGFITRPGKKK